MFSILLFKQFLYNLQQNPRSQQTMQLNQDKQPFIQIMPFSFQPRFQSKGQWASSDYGQNGNRHQNEEIRKSEYKFAVGSIVTFNLPVHNSNSQEKWRLIRYSNGKFIQHEDEKKQANHIGTQILIFPKSKSPHSKGSLLIRNLKQQNQSIEIQAQEFVYIYVFIPLGYLHQVTEVEGIRTVATRAVFDAKKKEFKQSLRKEHFPIYID